MSIAALSSQDATSYWEEFLKTSNAEKARQSGNLAAELFSDLDSDGDGKVSLEESGLDQQTYDALDTDRDGTVSSEELENALELQRSALFTRVKSEESGVKSEESGAGGEVFDALDINQDGIVSPEESAAFLEKQKQAANNGINPAGANPAPKAGDLLLSLADRAYSSVTRAQTSGQAFNFTA
ncbi:MAG: hypothetical protein LBQ51_05245 [Desulfovibrio sp.]|nr:hypothetical protein [Desulfovibrio sp.]